MSSDPVLLTQVLTPGVTTVSVTGSDGSGKSKVLSAAEVRAAAELSTSVSAAKVYGYAIIFGGG